MTVEGRLRMVGTREARAGLRSLVEQLSDGSPVAISLSTQPVAALLHPDEADRWERIERSLAALHGAEVYPELAANTSQLASLVRSTVAPSSTALRRLARERRQILSAPEYVSLRDARASFATVLERVSTGRPAMLVSWGRPVAMLVGFDEYQRLVTLSRSVSWFSAAGLDLAHASSDDVIAWLTAYRSGPGQHATEATEASA